MIPKILLSIGILVYLFLILRRRANGSLQGTKLIFAFVSLGCFCVVLLGSIMRW